MDQSLIATKSVIINADAAKIWDVLVNPEKIKVYLFGTQTSSDWQVGSPILFQGEYNGQVYKDKGNVLERTDNQLLKYNYWSGFSGLADAPENYSLITYTIENIGDNENKFTWMQQGFSSKEGKCHTEEGLGAMLEQIKNLAEG